MLFMLMRSDSWERSLGSMACAASLALVAGCGGKFVASEVDGGIEADGSVADSGSGSDGGGGLDGSGAHDGSGVDAGGPSCAEQQKKLEQLRLAARKCCPQCGVQQCTIAVKDLCCAISISANHQTDGDALSQAVTAYEQQCGPVACPATPCTVAPSLLCDQVTSLCK